MFASLLSHPLERLLEPSEPQNMSGEPAAMSPSGSPLGSAGALSQQLTATGAAAAAAPPPVVAGGGDDLLVATDSGTSHW